jgi:hypothetical protein
MDDVLTIIREACAEMAAGVEDTSARLCDVALDYQTGKDAHAGETIVLFTEQIQDLLTLLRAAPAELLAPDIPNVDAYHAEWNKLLNDLVEAFAGGDTVTVGDLAEYEIAPKFTELFNALSRIGGT